MDSLSNLGNFLGIYDPLQLLEWIVKHVRANLTYYSNFTNMAALLDAVEKKIIYNKLIE